MDLKEYRGRQARAMQAVPQEELARLQTESAHLAMHRDPYTNAELAGMQNMNIWPDESEVLIAKLKASLSSNKLDEEISSLIRKQAKEIERLKKHPLDKVILRDLFWWVVLPHRVRQWIAKGSAK